MKIIIFKSIPHLSNNMILVSFISTIKTNSTIDSFKRMSINSRIREFQDYFEPNDDKIIK
jgi:uncharacterized membrane protein (DUF106 family)